MKSIVHYEFSKNMGQFKDESLIAHCEIAGTIFNVELWTSFWNSRMTFFKKLWKKKVVKSS